MKLVVPEFKMKKKKTYDICCEMVSLKVKAYTGLGWNKSVED